MKSREGVVRLRAISHRLGQDPLPFEDHVTVEEPLEIRMCNGNSGECRTISVTMRTPGEDYSLAAGFLFTEGLLTGKSDIISLTHSMRDAGNRDNIIEVVVESEVYSNLPDYHRNFAVNSSCGVCGKSSINEVFIKHGKLVKGDIKVSDSFIMNLPARMMEDQEIFSLTGGIHAAGLYNREGEPVWIAEDIGRHNAVDKVIGHLFLNDMLPGSDLIMQLSGRAGFEIVQKAVMAGIPIISSVSAPSSLAVETANAFNSTLICFVRDGRFNVYTHGERIAKGQ